MTVVRNSCQISLSIGLKKNVSFTSESEMTLNTFIVGLFCSQKDEQELFIWREKTHLFSKMFIHPIDFSLNEFSRFLSNVRIKDIIPRLYYPE